MSTPSTSDILQAIDKGFTNQIAFTQDLVRFPSLRGQEREAQDFIHDALKDRGYKMDRWAIDINEIKNHPGFSPVTTDYRNAINVVGTHHPKTKSGAGRSLILNGHIDVVPEGPHPMWQRNPFDPNIDGDWLYGRGSGDMKAGLVANIFALDALRSLGYQPAAPVYIQSVTEEECTGNGALSCLAKGYTADAAIIPEPMNEQLIRANLGVIWFRVHLQGEPEHVAYTQPGANAIEASFAIIQALRDLEKQWNKPEHRHPRFSDHRHPINLNVGKIAGGDWASSVPAWCSFDCRIGIFPSTNAKHAAKEIEDCIRAVTAQNAFLKNNPPKVEFNGFLAEGYVLEEGTDAEKTLAKAHKESLQKNLTEDVFTGYLDARVFMLYDDCPCLVYGPISEGIHGFDERVSLASIKNVTGTIALFIAQWCGLETCHD